ncbi:two-component response regulator ORR26 isoform X2 [Elaeis guineensis]|uniref:Two-component response regulator ORR26 isoform X2 n=1 Tax=Elaeis guineensis var. tenera TaxID=51953 RepID=A0A6J0PBE1_ELAGV|nr:two-component response regulator ORR26 isoform X2 [Elaeis guineensis]
MANPPASTRTEAFPVGLRVLVVDDDPTWLKILEKMLRKCSYEVMSIDGETSRVMKGVQHGACDYLLKPVRMKELRNIWQHVYRKKMHEVKEIEGHYINEDIQIMKIGSDDFEDRHVSSGADINYVRKRKDVDNKEHSDQEFSDPATVKKARVVWSVDLHQKFVNAVNQIGFDKVGPKKILDLMNIPGLTRENVASHLQKYRLYLSRLQKQNEGRTSSGNLQSDFSSKDVAGNFDVLSSTQMQPSGVSSKFICTGQKIQAQGIIPDDHADDFKSSLSLQVTGSKQALVGDIPDSQGVISVSRLGILLPFKDMIPDAGKKSLEPAISRNQSWSGSIPVMQFMQHPRHDHECCCLIEAYSCLPKPDQEQVFDHFDTPPSVISNTCNTENDISGLLEFKLVHTNHRSSDTKTASQLSCMTDTTSAQVDSGSSNTQDYGVAFGIDGLTNIKDYYHTQTSSYLTPPSGELSLKNETDLVSSPEDLQFCSPQGIGSFENVGFNSMEIFQYDDSTSVTEVHSNWYDGLEFNSDYLYDSVDPVIDECLFA